MAEVRVSPRAEIKRVLLAETDVTALAGERIFIGRTRPEQGRIQGAYIELRNVGEVYKSDFYRYAYQRIDVYCVAPDNELADELDLIVYGILDRIVDEFPLVGCLPGGAYDIDEREFRDLNIVRNGIFRPYRVNYADSYTT